MNDFINLQNTPDPDDVRRMPVQFTSGDATLHGLLFVPAAADAPAPGVIVTGAWTTVKEQMAGTYARELARRGFAALAFDFHGWGRSEGDPRFVEDPHSKTRDIEAAVAFLKTHPVVDNTRVHGLGICASSGYMADVAAGSHGLRKLALVAPWLHSPEVATEIYGGPESVETLIEGTRSARQDPNGTSVVAASTEDPTSPMFNAPYYTEAHRGLIDAYDNRFNLLSWEPWVTYDAHASARSLSVPTLIVGSDEMALPTGVRAYVKATGAPVTKHWLKGPNQFDFYDRSDVVQASADAVARHFA